MNHSVMIGPSSAPMRAVPWGLQGEQPNPAATNSICLSLLAPPRPSDFSLDRFADALAIRRSTSGNRWSSTSPSPRRFIFWLLLKVMTLAARCTLLRAA